MGNKERKLISQLMKNFLKLKKKLDCLINNINNQINKIVKEIKSLIKRKLYLLVNKKSLNLIKDLKRKSTDYLIKNLLT